MAKHRAHRWDGLSVEDRFWMKVDKTPGQGPTGACWGWIGATDQRGYGMFSLPRGTTKMVRANRFALETRIGPLPRGVVARHTCDWPSCCNPAHLVPGSHAANMQGMVVRNRTRSGRRVLSSAEVAAIIERRQMGEQLEHLAKDFNVHSSHISRVARGLVGSTPAPERQG